MLSCMLLHCVSCEVCQYSFSCSYHSYKELNSNTGAEIRDHFLDTAMDNESVQAHFFYCAH